MNQEELKQAVMAWRQRQEKEARLKVPVNVQNMKKVVTFVEGYLHGEGMYANNGQTEFPPALEVRVRNGIQRMQDEIKVDEVVITRKNKEKVVIIRAGLGPGEKPETSKTWEEYLEEFNKIAEG